MTRKLISTVTVALIGLGAVIALPTVASAGTWDRGVYIYSNSESPSRGKVYNSGYAGDVQAVLWTYVRATGRPGDTYYGPKAGQTYYSTTNVISSQLGPGDRKFLGWPW